VFRHAGSKDLVTTNVAVVVFDVLSRVMVGCLHSVFLALVFLRFGAGCPVAQEVRMDSTRNPARVVLLTPLRRRAYFDSGHGNCMRESCFSPSHDCLPVISHTVHWAPATKEKEGFHYPRDP
jgi:hypothetical protein